MVTHRIASAIQGSQGPVSVLVVDDSAFMRYTITIHLGTCASIRVVGAARDGKEAIEMIPRLNPDVITLDVEMPRMDGLTTLRHIMAEFPRPVIMLSSLTTEGAIETIQALTLGAVDFVAKPAQKTNIKAVMDEVISKILAGARARVWRTPPVQSAAAPAAPAAAETPALSTPAVLPSLPVRKTEMPPKTVRARTRQDPIVLIGSSTGGPRALNAVIPLLPADLAAAYVVVQHMPAGFTRSLAERLNATSAVYVKEAEPGDRLEVGKVLLAPGGFHMTFDTQEQVALNQNAPVHGVRPAVDVTLTSLIQHYERAVIAVILTGMGSDGTNGSVLLHSLGGMVIAEDESSCVVWGMPRSVFEAGAASLVTPLHKVSTAIEQAVSNYSPLRKV